MPNILKYFEQDETIQSYDFPLDFTEEAAKIQQGTELEEGEEEAPEEEDAGYITNQEADRLLADARQEAEEILEEARQEAERLKAEASDQGHTEGYDNGYKEGFRQAYAEGKEKMDRQAKDFLMELQGVITSATEKKDDMIRQYSGDLRDIAVSIAEKVIQVGLKSSGKVIERMIISATDKIKNKEWAKIYIAKCDAEIVLSGDANLLEALSHLSEHVKIVVIDNESSGTCIIELPDEIIDASVTTQMENIKGILNSTGI